MPPRSPLPQLQGIDAAWVRTPGPGDVDDIPWATMGEFLLARLPARAEVPRRLLAGEFVDHAGQPLTGDEPYRPHTFVWFHRPVEPEPHVPFSLDVLYQDNRTVVADKPHFLATTPRGAHVRETALVRLRLELGLPELAPAHRLDRLTAGVLVFTTRREFRGSYAGLFQSRRVHKVYEALAPFDPAAEFPRTLVGRITKPKGSLQATLVDGEPNAETHVEVDEVRGAIAKYRLTPRTGQTHQLRVHMAALGLPIVGDSLYPEVLDVAADDFTTPLQLVARQLSFEDPVDGFHRLFTSEKSLAWPSEV